MKKRIINVVIWLGFLAGLSLLLYPTFSEYWNAFRQSRAITNYAKEVGGLDEKQCEEILRAAREYNGGLSELLNVYEMSDERSAEYEQILNVSGNGIMGSVEIPKIRCSLPIYHGTGESVLQIAVGHLAWTSLPVGGESTHAVLSGHRGLPSAKLFTDLDKMEVGDRFYVRVLNEVLAYETDQIKVVLPEETDDLRIVEGEDYCTLCTCTPYAVNTHRLLVRGHRVDLDAPSADHGENEIVDLEMLEKQRLKENFRKAVTMAGILAVVMAGLILSGRVSKRKGKCGGNGNEEK